MKDDVQQRADSEWREVVRRAYAKADIVDEVAKLRRGFGKMRKIYVEEIPPEQLPASYDNATHRALIDMVATVAYREDALSRILRYVFDHLVAVEAHLGIERDAPGSVVLNNLLAESEEPAWERDAGATLAGLPAPPVDGHVGTGEVAPAKSEA